MRSPARPERDSDTRTVRKTFAIVSAVYNVAPYLSDFIESIESQDYPLEDVEIVLVDDGSTDDSAQVLAEWARRRPDLVTVVTKPNGGQASARNLGLEQVAAHWVTFIDPDDKMGSGYLAVVRAQLDRYPTVPLVATNRIYLDDLSGRLRNGHPLRRMFADGDKRVELDRFPQYFWHHVGAGFFLVDEIRRLNLAFDERVRPNFEDGHFCIRYLLGTEQTVVFAASAHYHYRRRADQSSTLQRSFTTPEKYTHIPRYGYLDGLRRAQEQLGFVPEWLQNMILYDLTWYFTAEDTIAGGRTAASGDVSAQFIAALREIRGYLDDHVIESFKVRPIRSSLRELLLHALRDRDWHSPYVVLDRYDARRGLVRARYRYVGDPPREEPLTRGLPMDVHHHKTRKIAYFGVPLLCERIMWLSARGTLRVRLNGVPMPLIRREPSIPDTYLRPAAVARLLGQKPIARRPPRLARRAPRPALELETARLAMLSRSPLVRFAFRNAWVLIDRTQDAGDNAERLFEHLRAYRRDINAWFVIEPNTADWERLRSGPHRRRVIAYGSATWKLLMLNCAQLISSHAEAPIITPPSLAGLPTPDWKFTFLQHGVTKDNLSRWLNTKWMIDLFVTATAPEYESITGDGPYIFTSKEVRLTGMPRFDRLGRLAREADGPADLLLVAPTWRRWLNAGDLPGTQRKEVVADFADTQFAREWTEFLCSPALADLARQHSLQIGFLPHANIRPALDSLALPDHVTRLDGQADVQSAFARTALFVTDYSSMAFDLAYLGRPVLYFQFDRERTLHGDHTYLPGYYDYERDGFGPIAVATEQAVELVGRLLEPESLEWQTYKKRAEDLFAFRDERNCRRVIEAIEAL